MGAEATCKVTFKGRTASGNARLETDVLYFRGGAIRLSIPFREISKIDARGGALRVTSPAGLASFALGAAAEKWAHKIQHPPSRLEKIGVKADWTASAVGVTDQAFLDELSAAVGTLSIGRPIKNSDAIFFGATNSADLGGLAKLRTLLKPNGALWI